MTALLSGQKTIVVGGCGGIGRCLVKRLIQEGSAVAVLDLPSSIKRHPPPAGGDVLVLPVDATRAASVTKAFDDVARQWPTVDGFVNLAGFSGPLAPAIELTEDTLDEVFSGNLKSAFLLSCAAISLLKHSPHASLVHMSTGLSSAVKEGFGAYGAAKAGVNILTKTLALENAPLVRVNAVAPAAIDTAFFRGGTGRTDEDHTSGLQTEMYVKTVPMGRVGVPDDVVGPVLFLLSKLSAYMTGQILWVNGGRYMP